MLNFDSNLGFFLLFLCRLHAPRACFLLDAHLACSKFLSPFFSSFFPLRFRCHSFLCTLIGVARSALYVSYPTILLGTPFQR